jgi:hypothetical protein
MALTDNILAYWNLNDNGSGGVSLVDSTGNSNTLTNSNNVTSGLGIIAGGAVFNGTNNLANINFTPAVDAYSISIWVNNSVITGGNPTVCGSNNNQWGIYYDSSTGYNLTGFYPYNISLYQPVQTNTWYHYALVVDNINNVVSGYINGQLINTDTAQNIPLSAIVLGAQGFNYPNVGQFINGTIDEVGIWSRALSAIEIFDLYNGGQGITYPFVPSVYFNAAVNGNLSTLGNWWQDSGFTIPAVSLPTSTDPVVISATVTIGTGTYGLASINANIGSAVTINASSIIIYGGINSGTLVGITSLYNFASNAGTITGNTTLHNSSTNSGTITGNATLRNSSTNSGTITGNANIYYDGGSGTKPIGGIVDGSITYVGWPIKKMWFSSVASGTFNGSYSDVTNWWADSQLTIPAGVLPAVESDIVIVSFMYSAPSDPVVNSITIPSGGSTGFFAMTATNGVYIIGGQTSGTTFYTSGGSVGEEPVGLISRLLNLPWFINI